MEGRVTLIFTHGRGTTIAMANGATAARRILTLLWRDEEKFLLPSSFSNLHIEREKRNTLWSTIPI